MDRHDLRYSSYEFYGRLGSITSQRQLRDRSNPIEEFSDVEFSKRFRFSKVSFLYILNIVSENLKVSCERSYSIPPRLQLLITLRFYATGTFQMTDGDLFGVHQTSVCRIVHRTSEAIAKLRSRFVKFPNSSEQQILKSQFHKIANFPGVIGCIDGTHIELLLRPSINYSELYRCRKDYFSINVQVLFDDRLRIRDIVTKWYGSAHDSRIFNSSLLLDKLENLTEYTWVLGDSGYPCLPFLITPFTKPNTEQEERFNSSQKKTRIVAERGIGCWKKRFPCIKYGLGVKLENCPNIIVSTAVLHNLAIDLYGRAGCNESNDMGGQVQTPRVRRRKLTGNSIRKEIVQRYFSGQ